MGQGLQAVIAAAVITFLVGIFFAVQILFRRFLVKDRIKDPRLLEAVAEKEKRRHKKPRLKLKKKAG